MNHSKLLCLAVALGLSINLAHAAEPDGASLTDEVGQVVTEKAERQQDRVGNAVDNRIDQTTDRAVDKVLNKTLDKLFGR